MALTKDMMDGERIATNQNRSCISWDAEVIGQYKVFGDDPAMLQSIVWCCGTIGITVILMNLIVIWSILKARDFRQNSVYIFMLSLAVADLLTAFVFVSFFLKFHLVNMDSSKAHRNLTATDYQELLQSNDKKLKEYLVKLMLVTACLTASIGSLALTAIDRFVAVLRPFDYRIIATKRRCIFAVCIMWTASIAVSSLPVIGWRCSFGCNGFPEVGCSNIYPGISQSYLTFYVTVVTIMLLLVVLMYLYIFIIVWRHLQMNFTHAKEEKVVQRQTARGEIRKSIRLPRKSSIASLYELEMVDKPTRNTPAVDKKQYFELCRDNFRFVLVVDENLPEKNRMSENDIQTCFRGFIFFGDNRNRRKRKKRSFSNVSPAIARRRTNRRINQSRNRNQMQIVQTLILILGALLACWTPSLTFMIIDITRGVDRATKKAFAFLALLTLLNSAINPVIYAIRLKELRTMVTNVLCRRRRVHR